MIEFKTVKSTAEGTIIEKKSKFIATILPINSKKEAEAKINELKKKYDDAKHNCYAYSVLEDEMKITKSSDDGEPSGTAGIPILKVIMEENLCNVLVVVTRYFGGILLGTGGLQRAYTDATKRAIDNSNIIKQQNGYEMNIIINYNDLNYIKYYLEKNNALIQEIEYNENVNMKIDVTEKTKEEITNINSEIGNKIQKIETIYKKFIQKNADI